MFFYLSKIVWFFAQPSSLLILAAALGAGLLWGRFARAGRRLVTISTILLLVAAYTPLGQALILPLENRFSPADLSQGTPPDGLIVLGGAQDMLVTAARGSPALTEAGERMTETAALARRFPEARIVFTGGSGAILYDHEAEARGAADLFAGLGIARDRLELEARSRNTYQNAVFTRELVGPGADERWLLVTSAAHMPRAMGVFRAAGFDVEPWPVDYRTRGPADLTRFFYTPSEGLRRVDMAVREWAGLAVYRLTGRTDTLFPAPRTIGPTSR